MSEQRTRPVVYAVWLIIASVFGWWAAFQLTLDKFAVLENPDANLNCNVSVFLQCGTNLESWQGSVFGFPNPIIGLTGWMAPLVVGVAILAGARFPRWFWALYGLGITGAFVFICWLIGQSFFELHTLCPWCALTYVVVIPTFFSTVLQLFQNGTFPVSESARERAQRLGVWVPLASIVAFVLIIALAQFAGVDVIGSVISLF
ncbi:MAG: vitamin K epoxide reductase family protein [Microbacterium sp.]|uniref:Membrane protein n=1 Tax=Microbacterium natoriense TaxID=284570 RepID=A0AAW8EZD4_9MICO|nr:MULTISPECIES: vitamin K epoxide reductase family protein [Microbacterium]MBW8763177.1 vitamin K epoxide reductase family protein [Microbacterium sp.]MDQ0648693.1 putative membrane protein [Microbacterium natoriense]